MERLTYQLRSVSSIAVKAKGINLNRFGRLLTSLSTECVHTVKGNMYKEVMLSWRIAEEFLKG